MVEKHIKKTTCQKREPLADKFFDIRHLRLLVNHTAYMMVTNLAGEENPKKIEQLHCSAEF